MASLLDVLIFDAVYESRILSLLLFTLGVTKGQSITLIKQSHFYFLIFKAKLDGLPSALSEL